MNENDELMHAVREMRASQTEMRTALLGTLEHPETGALHIVQDLVKTIHRPDEPHRSFENRIRRLEDDRQQRNGASARTVAIWSVSSMFLGGAFEAFVSYLFSKH